MSACRTKQEFFFNPRTVYMGNTCYVIYRGSLGGILAVAGPDPRIFTDLQAPFHFLSRWRPISRGRHLNNPGHVFESLLGCPEADTYYTGPERHFSCTHLHRNCLLLAQKAAEISFWTLEPCSHRRFNSSCVSLRTFKAEGFEPSGGDIFLASLIESKSP